MWLKLVLRPLLRHAGLANVHHTTFPGMPSVASMTRSWLWPVRYLKKREHRNAQEVTGSSPCSAATQANSSQRSSGWQSEDCVDAPSRSLDSAAHPLPRQS